MNKYSSPEAWLHDYLIAERALNLHAYILEHGKLRDILALPKEQRLLDVGCGGRAICHPPSAGWINRLIT